MKPRLIRSRFLPWGNFAAITLFGHVFARPRTNVSARMWRHEMIHVRQQRELLYLPFFLLYLAEWLWLLLRYRNNYQAYRHISFEREAYENEGDADYLAHRPRFANDRNKR